MIAALHDILVLRDRIGGVAAPIAVPAVGAYLGWLAFAAARAARRTRRV
jgi:hypothetical protein